ncbi:MAG: hypothetical protein Ta2A_09450 [Treponemataceae bacterium]|nr:MAG: hypothetical protein Ta2A_09450 [Treponemataceae bacterium]
MAESTAWESVTYQSTFEEELRGLERRKAFDKNCSLQDIEMQLRAFYIQDGNNWEGRGPAQDIMLAATIAAYECFIDNWKKTLV